MNRTEIVQLCRLVKAVCPSQAIDQFTPDAWTLILGHVAYEDAKAAVVALAAVEAEPGKSHYIEPRHILGQVRRIRTKRIEDYGPVDPPSGLDAAEYLAWQRATLDAIASGTAPGRRELAANPSGQRRIAELAAGVGRETP